MDITISGPTTPLPMAGEATNTHQALLARTLATSSPCLSLPPRGEGGGGGGGRKFLGGARTGYTPTCGAQCLLRGSFLVSHITGVSCHGSGISLNDTRQMFWFSINITNLRRLLFSLRTPAHTAALPVEAQTAVTPAPGLSLGCAQNPPL